MPGSSTPRPTRLILARHGEACYESGVWADEGGSLTEAGRDQARRLGDRLADRGIRRVWTSTLARAVQTGEIAAANLGVPVTTRGDLREFAAADLAGTPRAEDPFLPTFAHWLGGDLAIRIPGGESGTELADRFMRALWLIATQHAGETTLVITHGGIMRITVPHLTRMDVPAQRIDHCATIEVTLGDEGWVCCSWDTPA